MARPCRTFTGFHSRDAREHITSLRGGVNGAALVASGCTRTSPGRA